MINLGSGNINNLPKGSGGINEIYLGNNLVYKYLPPPPPNYFYSEAIESGTFTFTIMSGVTPAMLEYVSYSTNGGSTWTRTNNVSEQEVIITTPTISAGSKVLWKGIGTQTSFNNGTTAYSTLNGSSNFNIGGNAASLLYGDNFAESQDTARQYMFSRLFAGVTTLISAENLILPGKTCNAYCYNYMFYGCSNLTKPPTILAEWTGNYAFYCMFRNCTSLTYIPEINVTSNGSNLSQPFDYIFDGCSSLTSADLSGITISGIELRYAFRNCTSLTSVVLPPNMTILGTYSFYQSGVTSTSFIHSKITQIDSYAFAASGASTRVPITTIDLSSTNITKILQYAFSYCAATSVILPSKLQSLSTYVFANTLITGIQFPSTLTSLGSYVFNGVTGLRTKTIDLSGCTRLTTLGMAGCQASVINIPSSVTTMGTDAFRSTRFAEIDLSSCTGLTTIPLRCFYQNESYTELIKLPSSITSILGSNFGTKTGAKLVCYATTPPTCASTLTGTARWSLYVPYSADHSVLTAYQNDQYWGACTNILELNPDGTIPT